MQGTLGLHTWTWGTGNMQGTLGLHTQTRGTGSMQGTLSLHTWTRGITAHTCDPSSWEAEARRSELLGHLWLHSEFKAQPGLYKTMSQKDNKGFR